MSQVVIMKRLKLFILSILILFSFTLNVNASEYDCNVTNVVNNSLTPTDDSFIANNLKKKFIRM